MSGRAAQTFAGVPDPSVAALSDRFGYLAADFGLEVRHVWPREDRAWTPEDLADLTAWLRREKIPVVLHHRDPAAPIAEAVRAGGARLIVLDTLETGPSADMAAAFAVAIETLGAALSE